MASRPPLVAVPCRNSISSCPLSIDHTHKYHRRPTRDQGVTVQMKHETMSSQSETEDAETAGDAAGDTAGDTAETAVDPTADEMAAAEAIADEPGEEPAGATPPDGDGAAPEEPGQVPSFLREIARAMQAAVDRERGRITAEETTSSLDAHVQKVRVRAATEAADLKRLASRTSTRSERGRRPRPSASASRRRAGSARAGRILGRHLRQHEALVDREISGASEAFERNIAPSWTGSWARVSGKRRREIARLVELLPEPPNVDDVAAAARAHAFAQLSRSEAAADAESAGPDVVGVMDPGVVGASAESTTVASDLDDLGRSRRRSPRRPSLAELDIPLGLVVFIAVLAIMMVVVLTGQGRAG